MPQNPDMYLNEITLTVLDDLYKVIKDRAAAQSTSIEALVIECVRTGLGLGPTPRLPIESLREKLIEEMKLYATEGLNGVGILMRSEDHSVFAVVFFNKPKYEHFADAGLIARIAKDYIVIERDQNDKVLVDALIQAGVPRAQIILAYAGEPVPEMG